MLRDLDLLGARVQTLEGAIAELVDLPGVVTQLVLLDRRWLDMQCI